MILCNDRLGIYWKGASFSSDSGAAEGALRLSVSVLRRLLRLLCFGWPLGCDVALATDDLDLLVLG